MQWTALSFHAVAKLQFDGSKVTVSRVYASTYDAVAKGSGIALFRESRWLWPAKNCIPIPFPVM
jgi:hypothetical protein